MVVVAVQGAPQYRLLGLVSAGYLHPYRDDVRLIPVSNPGLP